MTQEDKELLLKDLCARLLYGVKVKHSNTRVPKEIRNIDSNGIITVIRKNEGNGNDIVFNPCGIENIKPYLRPISSMTEEESREFEETLQYTQYTLESYDWLISHHFDYRGLIEKGLALEAPEGMYKTK